MADDQNCCWSCLPPELITSIAQLLSVPDLLRFHSVCKSWLSSSSSTTPSSPHFPWLLLIPTFSFFALPENKSYNLSNKPFLLAPSTLFTTPLGASTCNGYLALLLRDTLRSFLFNPITGSLTDFPPFSTFTSSSYVRKIAFSSSAPLTAVAVCGAYGEELAFARPGDVAWTPLDTLSYEFGCEDVVWHEGKFFAVSNSDQVVEAFDLSGSAPIVSSWADHHHHHHHLLDDADHIGYPGDVYLVSSPTGLLKVRGVRCKNSGKILNLVVCRFSTQAGKMGWEDIEDLGDESLFVSRKNSFSLSAKSVRGVKGNCIYLIPERRLYEDIVAGVQVFDMKVGVFKPFFPAKFGFDCEVSSPLLWFMPSLV